MRIEIDALSFTYPTGVEALRGVTLEIEAGARVALLGQNGAGKTTLVKHLNGMLKPSRGAVRVGDWDTREHTVAQMARRVGFAFQNPDDQLFKTRVWDEVAYGPTNFGLSAGEIEKQVKRALELCSLEEVSNEHPYDLPSWQRRWVGIASVLAMQTAVVVLDEPTTGQDKMGQARLASLLDWLTGERVTVITVTHDVDLAVEHFEDLVIMDGGKVIARGDAAIFANKPVVAQAALEMPQIMRLSKGLGLSQALTTPEEFIVLLEHMR